MENLNTNTLMADVILGVVQALGGRAETVNVNGAPFIAVTLDMEPWTSIDGLNEADREIAEFRKAIAPVIRATDFTIDGTSTGFSHDRAHYSFRMSLSPRKRARTANEEFQLQNNTGRD